MTFTTITKKKSPLRPSKIWSLLLLAIVIFCTLPAPTALAAGPVVTTHLDENDHSCGDGDCSLRDAIETIPFWETRIITFAPTLAGQTITLTAGQLEIYADLTINGTVPITISGNNASRVFYIGHTAVVALSHVGIISGTADDGGGIYNDGGWIMISGSNISGNIATDDGGGIHNNGGRVIIYDSKITHNSAGSVGGGIFNHPLDNNTVTVADSIISENSAISGGGLYNLPGNAMIMTNCIISGNTYRSIHNENGTVIVKNSTVSDNTGEIHNDGGYLTVDSSTISGNSGGGINDSYGNTMITVTNSIVYGNTGRGISGAELIKNSTISGNLGGGIAGGTVVNSTISGNSADKGGGIIGNGPVISSTISGNSANEGGGIYSSRLTIRNSTISGNSATNSGGGIYGNGGYNNNSAITMTNVTVSDNLASNGGGLFIAVDSTAYLQNSIIANSRGGGDCQNEGSIGANSHNLIEDGSCNPAFIGDPRLGALGNYGGNTWTHALLTGSPAIDAGDNSLCPETDQRGVVRPYDGDDDDSAVCDIGAYEFNSDVKLSVYLPVVVKP